MTAPPNRRREDAARGAGALLRAYYEALDTGRLEALADLFAPDAAWSFPGTALRGPDPVRRVMARALATGLVMRHDIGHLVEGAGLALCELVATNRLGDRAFVVPGAVVCEARDGRITRLAAYPEAGPMRAFLAALWGTEET
jgi:ketosteroid isomerase-like protein